MDILIKNTVIVTQDRNRKIANGDIYISDGRIDEIGKNIRADADIALKSRSQLIALPGFINTHAHIAMTPLRGKVDDIELSQFLDTTSRFDSRNNYKKIYYSAVLGILSMIRSGITHFVDFYYGEDAIAKAIEDIGYNAHLAWVTLDKDKTTQKGDPISNAEHFIKQYKGSGSVKPMVAVQGVYAAGKETFGAAAELADKYDTLTTAHVAETYFEVVQHFRKYRRTPLQWLNDIGFVNRRLIAVHCVWLSRSEIAIAAKKAGAVSYNPTSNMKLASGIAPISRLASVGANITLGTDSVASNNSLDMFNEMKYGSLLQKVKEGNAKVLDAQSMLDFATVNGAKMLGEGGGTIEVGKPANIVLLNPEPNMLPMPKAGGIVKDIVYAANPGNVAATIVNGQLLYNNGFAEGIEKLRDEALKFLSRG
ncbi:MAG: amidohydrolase family protein [Candidatus Micrarchaeia archaeon]